MNDEGTMCDNMYVNEFVDFIDYCNKDMMSMF